MTEYTILKSIADLPVSLRKRLLKSITEVHETAYRRGFQQGAYFLARYCKCKNNAGKKYYEDGRMASWRYTTRRVNNSPLHKSNIRFVAGGDMLMDIMLYYADKYIKALKGADLCKDKLSDTMEGRFIDCSRTIVEDCYEENKELMDLFGIDENEFKKFTVLLNFALSGSTKMEMAKNILNTEYSHANKGAEK